MLRIPSCSRSGRWPLAHAGVAVALSLLLLSPHIRAQAPGSTSAAQQADVAFNEGRELFEQGRFKEACEKFELSMHFEPSPGTLLNLGNCYEPQGDLLRALATFEQALADAAHAPSAARRKMWSNAARERIASLTPRIPELTVDGAEPGSSVSLDGDPMAEPGVALRLNPGRHELQVSAPGKRTLTKTFEVSDGQRLGIHLPALEAEVAKLPEPVSAPVALAAPPPDNVTGQRRFGPWPWIAGGTGAALLGTSLVTGLMASSKANQLQEECDGKSCDAGLEGVKSSAASLALATDVLWITGALTLGAGVTLFIVDRGRAEPSTSVQAGCFDAGCGLLARGRF